jgi:hypothetical protein
MLGSKLSSGEYEQITKVQMLEESPHMKGKTKQTDKRKQKKGREGCKKFKGINTI